MGTVRGLVEMRVGSAADDRNGGNSGFLKWHVIAAREKAEEIHSVPCTGMFAGFCCLRFVQSRDTDRESTISYTRMIDIDHRHRIREWPSRVVHIEP